MLSRRCDPRTSRDVLLVTPFFRDGGVERAWLNLAEGFLELGLDPHLVVLDRLPPRAPYAVPPGVRVTALDAGHLIQGCLRLRALVRRELPMLVIGGLTPANLAVLAATAGVRPRVPAVVSVHVDVGAQEGVGAAHLLVSRLLHRWVLSRADAVVAPSRGVVAGLERLGIPPRKLHTIPNPIVAPSTLRMLAEPCPHPWLAPGVQVPVVVGMGRLTGQKDFATLIRALHRVRDVCPVRLLILGDGPERPALEALVRELGLGEAVDLPGFVANPFPFLRGAAVFCLSSRWEGFGNVLVEALAAGTPVVSTDCPSGPREILEDGAFGRLVPVGDQGALAHALLDALQAPPPAEPLRAHAEKYRARVAACRYLQAAGFPSWP